MSQPFYPLLMTVEKFAELNSISETTVRECINGTSKNYPPLMAKQVGQGSGKRIYITAEQALEWRESLADR